MHSLKLTIFISFSILANGCVDEATANLNITTSEGEPCYEVLEELGAKSCDQTKKFLVGVTSVSWYKANYNCERYGYKLASIVSKEENDNVMKQLKLQGEDSPVAWIGLNDLALEGNYTWASNVRTPVTYTNWYVGEPNNADSDEDCVSMYPDGSWNDWNCRRRFIYVCQYFYKC